jgi:hypothetical protein
VCGVFLALAVFAAPVLAPAREQFPASAYRTGASLDAHQPASHAGGKCGGWFVGRPGVLNAAPLERPARLPPHGEAHGSTSPGLAEPISLGASQRFELPAVWQATLFTAPMYRVEVPNRTVSMTIDLESASPLGGDIDLYVSRTVMPSVSNGIVVSDFAALGPTSSERIVINRTTSPSLEPGTYYIALGMVTRAVAVTGALRITIETENEGRFNLIQRAVPGHSLQGPVPSSRL